MLERDCGAYQSFSLIGISPHSAEAEDAMGTAVLYQTDSGATASVAVNRNTTTNIVAPRPTSVKRKRVSPNETAEGTKPTKAIKLDRLGSYYPGYWINHGESSQAKAHEGMPHTQVIDQIHPSHDLN